MWNEDLKSYLFLLIWAILANSISAANGYYTLPKGEFYPNAKLRFRDIFGVFIVFLLIQLVLVPSGLLLFNYLMTGEWLITLGSDHGWINVIAIVASVIGLLLFCKFAEPQTAPLLSFQGISKFKKDFIWGMASWVVCFPVVSLFAQIFSTLLVYFNLSEEVDQVAVHYLKQIFHDRALFWSSFWMIIFLVPFVEELLFRGFLQTWLRQKMGAAYAIAITSAIFAGFHFSFSQGWHNVDLLAALFLLSCYLGLLYEKRNSIWAPIALHLTFNAISEIVIVSQAGGF